MASITVPVPDPLQRWVESRVESGGYASAGDYLQDLILRDRADSDEREALVGALECGEASGISERSVPDILAALRREVGGQAA